MRLPFFSSIRPTLYLFKVLGVVAAFGLVLGLARIFSDQKMIEIISVLWFLVAGGLFAIALYDALRRVKPTDISVSRVLPNSFALNRPQTIKVCLSTRLLPSIAGLLCLTKRMCCLSLVLVYGSFCYA